MSIRNDEVWTAEMVTAALGRFAVLMAERDIDSEFVRRYSSEQKAEQPPGDTPAASSLRTKLAAQPGPRSRERTCEPPPRQGSEAL